MNEIWKDVVGYEGLYKVSNTGKVKSMMFINNIVQKPREKIIDIHVSKRNGRCYASLYKNTERKNCTVHRLVAKAFIPNPDNLPEVNHKDGNTLNNNVDNLEWCTKQYNSKHAYENNLSKLKEYNESQKKPIIRNDGKTYDCAYNAAKDIGVSVCSIRDVLKGRTKSCKGYVFQYGREWGAQQ